MIVRLFIDLCMKKDWRIGTRVGLVMSQSKNLAKGIGPSMSHPVCKGPLGQDPSFVHRPAEGPNGARQFKMNLAQTW